MYNKIPEEYRQLLKDLGRKYLTKLTQLSREDNKQAIESLKEYGIIVVPPSDSSSVKNYYEIGAVARKNLTGKFYSHDLLSNIETHIAEFRKAKDEKEKNE